MKHQLLRIALIFSILLLVGQGCVSLSGDKPQTTGAAGMFISTDKGESWQSISSLPQADGVKNISSVSVYRLFEDPQDPKTMYWASRSNGLFYTYDDGKTWQHAASPLNTGFIYGVAVHPNDKCTIYVANAEQLFRSTDCNRSWTEVYRESGTDRLASVAIDSRAPHHVYLLKSSGSLLKSEDTGISWQNAPGVGYRSIDIMADPHHAGMFFITTADQGIWRSTDGVQSWNPLSQDLSDLPGSNEYRRLWISPTTPNHLYYVSTYGIHRSTDNGNSWNTFQLIHPPGSALIYAFGANPENEKELYYTATINQRSTFYKTVDGGQNWITKRVPSGQLPTALRVHPVNTDWVYLGFTIPPQS